MELDLHKPTQLYGEVWGLSTTTVHATDRRNYAQQSES
jgi:hypothetical protein